MFVTFPTNAHDPYYFIDSILQCYNTYCLFEALRLKHFVVISIFMTSLVPNPCSSANMWRSNFRIGRKKHTPFLDTHSTKIQYMILKSHEKDTLMNNEHINQFAALDEHSWHRPTHLTS